VQARTLVLPALDAKQMTLKLIFDPKSGEILGAQGVGIEGVDKRIDVIATAMRDAETPVAARGAQDSGGQSLFKLSCTACHPDPSRLPFSFICAVAPELISKLRKQLFSVLLASISGGSSPFARCACGEFVFIGVSHECEVLCEACGFVTTVGDCRRGLATGSIYPHPGVTSDSAFQWYGAQKQIFYV